MSMLKEAKSFFPKTREVLLPVSGAVWAVSFVFAVFQCELSHLLSQVFLFCVVSGWATVIMESAFLSPPKVIPHLITYIYTLCEPIAFAFLLVVSGYWLGFYQLPSGFLVTFKLLSLMMVANCLIVGAMVAMGLFLGVVLQRVE